jgi:hypothetical protein
MDMNKILFFFIYSYCLDSGKFSYPNHPEVKYHQINQEGKGVGMIEFKGLRCMECNYTKYANPEDIGQMNNEQG